MNEIGVFQTRIPDTWSAILVENKYLSNKEAGPVTIKGGQL